MISAFLDTAASKLDTQQLHRNDFNFLYSNNIYKDNIYRSDPMVDQI